MSHTIPLKRDFQSEFRSEALSVVVVDEELPFPTNSGKRIRTFNLLKHLASRHRITFVARKNRDPDELQQATVALEEAGIDVQLADELVSPPTAQYGPLRLYSGLAKNLFSREPYLVQNQRIGVLAKLVDKICRERAVDVIHCEWTPLAGGAAIRDAKWVVIAHNVESLIWKRYIETESNPLKRWYISRQCRKMERFEKWALNSATRSVAVSDADRQIALHELGVEQMSVVENGVDTEFFRTAGPRAAEQRVLFLGSLDWRPNLDAVQVILKNLLPQLKSAFPDVIFDIVGRRAPQWLVDFSADEPSLQIHSDVPDVRPYLKRCAAMVVPLRIGGGSRLKILEALAMETPVVSTSIGAEGLNVVHGQHLAIADTPEAMSAELARCLRDPAYGQKWGDAGRQLVEAEYDWRVLSKKLEEVWLDAARS